LWVWMGVDDTQDRRKQARKEWARKERSHQHLNIG
jgi:hypothetical protein